MYLDGGDCASVLRSRNAGLYGLIPVSINAITTLGARARAACAGTRSAHAVAIRTRKAALRTAEGSARARTKPARALQGRPVDEGPVDPGKDPEPHRGDVAEHDRHPHPKANPPVARAALALPGRRCRGPARLRPRAAALLRARHQAVPAGTGEI